jgi:hypothetical protein
MQKGLRLYARIQLDLGPEIPAYSSQQQMLSQYSSAVLAVLAGQRVAQASQAKFAAGQNHNKRFPQYQATQAETFLRKSAVKPSGQRATQASQANSTAAQAGLQNQNKRFFVIVRG